MTKFLLDSGDPQEYNEISQLAKKNNSELWGSTTNPSLIAKKLKGKKVSKDEAFKLQKQIVSQITQIVPGPVSAEVYADQNTTAEEMIKQGKEIATWHKHVVVKLPTTLEGFKARTTLRKEKIMTNNTLVFSQEQIFAICLHELLMQKLYGPIDDIWPPFISPFVGRLDDLGEDGMALVENGMKIKQEFMLPLTKTSLLIWMLEASVRNIEHFARGIASQTELITAPASIYKEWFALNAAAERNIPAAPSLKPKNLYAANEELFIIDSIDQFMNALENNSLNIHHDLTDSGIIRFTKDWKAIIQ